jgi:hypothetical protein
MPGPTRLGIMMPVDDKGVRQWQIPAPKLTSSSTAA